MDNSEGGNLFAVCPIKQDCAGLLEILEVFSLHPVPASSQFWQLIPDILREYV